MRTPWYKTASGSTLLEAEKKGLEEVLPDLHGYFLLQLAPEALIRCMESSLILNKINIPIHLDAHYEALPILSESIDVVMLNHTLERCRKEGAHVHQILREAYRVLIPGGHLVITGFNPFSLWGLKHSVFNSKTKLVSRHTIVDWLSLLSFECIHPKHFALSSFFSPLYTFVAVKRVIPLSLIKKPVWVKTSLEWGQQEGNV